MVGYPKVSNSGELLGALKGERRMRGLLLAPSKAGAVENKGGREEFIPSPLVSAGASHWLNPQEASLQGFLGDIVHRGQPSGAHKGKRKIKTRSWEGVRAN